MPETTTESGAGQDLAQQARTKAEQFTQPIAERVRSQKSTVTREMMGLAQALRNTAEQCEGQEQVAIANYARRAADGIERIGQVLERKSFSEMVQDLERVCRERPMMVGAAALAVGLLGARVARTAVSATREQQGDVGYDDGAGGGQRPSEFEVPPGEGGV